MNARNVFALVATASLPLMACSSEPEVAMKNATVGEVAKEVADGGTGSFVSPGKWESRVTMEEMSMPGMPPQAAAQMKGMMGSGHTVTACLTPEDVKKPKEDFFTGGETGCRYDHFTMAGGKIDAAMKCTRRDSTQVMQLKGAYSANSYTMAMSANTTGAGPTSGMKMRMRVNARRLGECDGTEKS